MSYNMIQYAVIYARVRGPHTQRRARACRPESAHSVHHKTTFETANKCIHRFSINITTGVYIRSHKFTLLTQRNNHCEAIVLDVAGPLRGLAKV